MITFSPQQQDVITWVKSGKGSTFVEAVAGSGKTTLLVGAMLETTGSVAYVAYNKKIVSEIEAKVAKFVADAKEGKADERWLGLTNRLRMGTFHSFGYGAWRRAYPSVQLDAKAKEKQTAEHLMTPRTLLGIVPKLIGLAKQRAIGLFGSVDDQKLWFDIVDHFDLAHDLEDAAEIPRAVELAIKGLKFHMEIADRLIDFDDMIFMPVVKGIQLYQNDWLMTDESQDTNPARRALARKMLRPNGRSIWVGDRHQAIYGFTGADSDAIDQISRDFNCGSMPLTVSFRCPKAVVALAQTVVSHIQAAESAPEGHVGYFDDKAWAQMANPGGETTINGHAYSPLTADDAILCRNTKPLVQTAYRLIRKGIAAHIEGKEIGTGLLKLVNKFSARDLDQLRDKLEKHLEDQVAKLIAKGRETQAEALQDRIETIFVIADECKDLDELRTKIATLFLDADAERKPTLTMATYHRSKGREWNRVWLLGHYDYSPSKWARQAWAIQQESNAAYVAFTRAKRELIFIPAPL